MFYQQQQQIYCTTAINTLDDAKYQFQSVKNVDGRTKEGREKIIDDLFQIEEDMRIVQKQIVYIRNMYSNLKVEDEADA